MFKTWIKHALLKPIPKVAPQVVAVLKHDTESFTQGLAYSSGKLYESTGLDDSSSIRRLCADSGEVELVRTVSGHWAEGIALSGDQLVQLTWKSEIAFVYLCPDLELIAQWKYQGEGWGLTVFNDGFLMSDGSERLTMRDAEFNAIKVHRVRLMGYPFRRLNDIAYADGFVYANRLGENRIYEIDVHSGSINRIIDCSCLRDSTWTLAEDDVLNGIAYNPEKKIFYVTGKRWPLIYQIRISD